MNAIGHMRDMMRLLMRPLKPRHEIFLFKLTRAVTPSNVNRFLAYIHSIQIEKPFALMLSVNTAVGSFAQAQRMHDALKQVTHNLQVPLYTFAEDYAIGVGYYLLSSGQVVHANPFSLIGDFSLNKRSIGFTELLKKNNIQVETYGKTQLLDAFQKVTDENRIFIQQHLQIELDTLIAQVKENRSIQFRSFDETNLKELLSPKVYNAEESVSNGLIDKIQTFEEFRSELYPNSRVKEVSVEKDASQMGIIRAELEIKLFQNINAIMTQQAELNEELIQDKLIGLLREFVKSDRNNMIILSDLIADYVNDQIVNPQLEIQQI